MTFKRARIVECKPQENYKIWVRFDDGLVGEVDLSNLVGRGIFASWLSIEFFKSVYVDKISETVAWGEDIDLDPYVLRNKILKSNTLFD